MTCKKAACFLAELAGELIVCVVIVVVAVIATPFIVALQFADMRRGGR